MSGTARHTLPGRDYRDPEVFAVERTSIFLRSWFYAARAEQLLQPGDWVTVDVVGESVLVVRGDDGALRGFFNVCRHRGSRLRTEPSGHDTGTIMCPYHAWCYDLRGDLVVTPRVGDDEVDKASLPLWPVHVDEWEGFVFVNLSRGAPEPVRDWIGRGYDDLLGFERFRMGELRVGATQEWVVEANWKIIVENYNECLHCPTVHPELIEVIPAYRKGWVLDDERDDGGVWLASGSTYAAGEYSLPVMASMTETEARSVYGGTIFPNVMIDISGTVVIVTQLFPISATRTRQVVQYLFTQEAVTDPSFDPSGVVDFGELVGGQDNAICERVQLGVGSLAFDHGVYPEKDVYVWEFNQRYLRERDGR
jgi:phenylpropionate dioxygenase-like ring-hydroxylating dioxygenase large terminal subunit